MKSDLLDQSPEPAIRHSPGSDFESEESRYAGREPQEIPTDPAENPDEQEQAGGVRSFAGLYSVDADTTAYILTPPKSDQAPAAGNDVMVSDDGDAVRHRVLDNTVPFHPEDPLRETN